jgi:hypothetical protein
MPFSEIARFRTVVASKVGKGRCRRGVGQVIGRDVNGLHGRDRTLVGCRDAFLHRAHVGCQGWLVTHSGRNTAEKRGHFGTGLGEAEDVVHEEQNVLPLVAEVFGNRQTGQSNTCTGSGRLIHLAVNQGRLGAFSAAFLVHAGFDHFPVKVVAFTGPLTNTGKHGVTAVRLRDVVDQFHDENGLAHAGAAEQADLAALRVRGQKVDDLDAGDQDFGFGGLFDEFRSFLVDGALGVMRNGPASSTGSPITFMMRPRVPSPTGTDRLAGVNDFLTANQTLGGIHRDGTNRVFAQVLSNFQHQAVALVVCFKSVQDQRQVVIELDVDNGADDLGDPSDLFVSHIPNPRLDPVRALQRPR